jgi:D-amino-acid dehydrogenase
MRTIVLGAGVIGTTTAWYLARHGHEVTVVERRDAVARETSFANGGVLHSSEAEPWSRPGMGRNLVRWIGREDAPLLLRPRALPRVWRWGLAFMRNCRPGPFRDNTRVNLRLTMYTLGCIKEIREATGIAYDAAMEGSLKVYTSPRALDAMEAEARLMTPHGLVYERLDAKGCVAREPALAPIEPTLAGGLYFPLDEHGDCRAFTEGLAGFAAREHGVTFHFGRTVTGLRVEGGRASGVETDQGPLKADSIVVALGSYTPGLLRPHGIRLAIQPVKGVTVSVPAAAWPDGPRVPIIDDSRLFGLIRIGERYRCSGSAEIDGFDATPSRARCEALVKNVIGVFPDLARCWDPETAQLWAGLRPMTPSGIPYLGPTPIGGLFVNAGHGHLGWTMSCGSARVVADLVAGKQPGIDVTGLTLATRA